MLAPATAACTDSSTTGVVVDDPVGDTIDEGRATGTTIAAQAFGELSADDYQTMIGKTGELLATLHDGEIQQASFAIQVVQDDDVFDYANNMIIEHEDGLALLDDTMRFYGAPYIPSQAQAQLMADAQAALADLRATPPQDIDFRYMEVQVRMHASAQVILDQLSQLVGPGAMNDYIINARGMVDEHFDRATSILETYY